MWGGAQQPGKVFWESGAHPGAVVGQFQCDRQGARDLVILNPLQRVKLSRVAGVRARRRNPERSEGTLSSKATLVPWLRSGFRQQALPFAALSVTPAKRLNFALRAHNYMLLAFSRRKSPSSYRADPLTAGARLPVS